MLRDWGLPAFDAKLARAPKWRFLWVGQGAALFFLLAACAGPRAAVRAPHPVSPRLGQYTVGPKYKDLPDKTTYSKNKVSKLLNQQLQSWKGTPYQIGGNSKQGIDCSGFVYLTYTDKLGIELPRTTELQGEVGREISQEQLTYGDLVFFKIGIFTRHVGIYTGNREFIHASTSRGVMKSSLDSYYWSRKYWKARRVIYY